MPEKHVIATARNGELDGTGPDDITNIVDQACIQGRLVVHFHGGLVNKASGISAADRLTPVYIEAGAYPVFMVWQSGLLEVISHNLDEILNEELFKGLLRRALQFTVGKFRQEDGQRAAGMVPTPKIMEVDAALDKLSKGEPYRDADQDILLSEVTEKERAQLERVILADNDLRAAVRHVVEERHPEEAIEGSRGVVVTRRASSSSLIDPLALAEIDQGVGTNGEKGERGLVSTAVVARKAGAVLTHVIKRFLTSEDHGVYPTVVEEILREFYVANVGAAVWAAMKNETDDTFADPHRGGRLLVDKLAEALTARSDPIDITLVGHSAGAVYIDNLLTEIAKGRAEGYRSWPENQRMRVVLLAPAATYESFTTAMTNENLISDMRVFTMTDESEQADHLLGPAYPRSLLYFVSGVVERDPDGESAVMPLIGMARYRLPSYASRAELAAGREYLTDERVVLSPSPPEAGVGRRTSALTHGAFDDDPLVLESIAHLIGDAR